MGKVKNGTADRYEKIDKFEFEKLNLNK